MDLSQLLASEHKAMIAKFDHLFANCHSDRSNWLELIDYCDQSIECNHHRKEEDLLFSAVRDNPKIRSGGPMCSMFFDSHMLFSTLRIAQKISKDILGYEVLPEWSSGLKKDQDANSPLCIPGEDHESGRMLIRVAKLILQNKFETNYQAHLTTLFKSYREIQTNHFIREENCFFKMCRNLISNEEWDQISAKMLTDFEILK